MPIHKIIIVGAGPAGLYCARRLSHQYEVHLYEKQPYDTWLTSHPYPTDGVFIVLLALAGCLAILCRDADRTKRFHLVCGDRKPNSNRSYCHGQGQLSV